MNKNLTSIKKYEEEIAQFKGLVESDRKIIHLQETQIQLMEDVIAQKDAEIALLNEKYEELMALSKEMESLCKTLTDG